MVKDSPIHYIPASRVLAKLERKIELALAGRKAEGERADVYFVLVGEIERQETIAAGSGIRELARLRRIHGRGRWRKRKGIAQVRLFDGTVRQAEIHWYEATGVGRRELKIKRFVD